MHQQRSALGAGIATAFTTFALAACSDSSGSPIRHEAMTADAAATAREGPDAAR